MNLLLFEPGETPTPQGGRVVINGRRALHIAQFLKSSPGDRIRVGAIGGLVGEATVVRAPNAADIRSGQAVSVELDVQLIEPPPPAASLVIVLSLQRPKSMPRILSAITSFGVKEIWVVHSARVEKPYWSCEQISPQRVRESLLLGLEQARDTVLPEVHIRKRFKPFVEDELPHLARGRRALFAHPYAERAAPGPSAEPTLVALGPEGGFTESEIKMLGLAGLEGARLGVRPLRTESAVPALLGRLLE